MLKRDPYRHRPYSKLEAALRVLVPNRRSWRSFTLAGLVFAGVVVIAVATHH